jgi:hypothetical protein
VEWRSREGGTFVAFIPVSAETKEVRSMAGNVLSVILVTWLAGKNVAPASVPESRLHVVEGELLSYGSEILVLLTDAGETMTFDLARGTEAPEPLVSGAHVRVEYVARTTGLEALIVYLAAEGAVSSECGLRDRVPAGNARPK